MVLEGSSNDAPISDFASESTPQSDLDPYAGSSAEYIESRSSNYIKLTNSNPPIYINAANLPRPIGVSTWFQLYEKAIPNVIKSEEDFIQRPVTQEEANALAEHIAATVRVGSWGPPIGGMLGTLQFIRGMRRFRFPFYTPFKDGSRFSPDRFGPLRGRLARATWHTARFGAYGFVGTNLAKVGFASYAFSMYAANKHRDPRLKDLTEIREQKMKERRQQQREGALKSREGREEGERASQKGESVEMWRMRKQAETEEARNRQTSRDDMSPNGGAFENELRVQSDSGFAQDNWSTPQEGMNGGSWQADGTSSEAPPRQQASSTNLNTSSSTPPRQTSSPTQQPPSTTKQSGSAWDRLRQNAQNANSGGNNKSPSSSSGRPTTSNSPQPTAQTSSNDSFSFSQREEQAQLARSEAQKEFDARVEKEREGKDFEDQSGKRW